MFKGVEDAAHSFVEIPHINIIDITILGHKYSDDRKLKD